MDMSYWHKQTPEQPLFPDLLWSRPENKRQAGKLLIVGGNAQGFAAAAEAYAEAQKAGIGTSRVLLPDSLQKTVGRVFEAGEYAPSTPSGSFGMPALAELCDLAAWVDGVLLAGDFGRNSETAILFESFLMKYSGLLTITGDAIDYFYTISRVILERHKTTLVPTLTQLQKLLINYHSPVTITASTDFLHAVEALHNLSTSFAASLMFSHLETVFVAHQGTVTTTKPLTRGHISLASYAAVWQLQNPDKALQALTSSALTS